MSTAQVRYGPDTLRLRVPAGVRLHAPAMAPSPGPGDPLALVADALDHPLGAAPLAEAARGKDHVAIVVPDPSRPAAVGIYLLPVLARLARAGFTPGRIRVVMARGIQPTADREDVERTVGQEVMQALRPVQAAPESPEWNAEILQHEELGSVRVHRVVAEAGLVVLTGGVAPHALAGFSGGPESLVPGVAERETVLAAHRITLRTLVAPDGSLTPALGRLDGNPFRATLLEVARAFGRCTLLGVVLDAEGRITGAAAGDVDQAQRAAAAVAMAGSSAPVPCDAVLVGGGAPRSDDLLSAHRALLAALPWARPGAPIVWLARAPHGPGHADFLPWFEAGRLDRHLAALRARFHPYGLKAYAVRRIAKDHPVHVVSEVEADVTRGMGLLPQADAQAALDAALSGAGARTLAVLADPRA